MQFSLNDILVNSEAKDAKSIQRKTFLVDMLGYESE